VENNVYFICGRCEAISIENRVLADVDAGKPLVEYKDDYWRSELAAARQRSYGPALARVAETILYARRPIARFLDIGTGPGYLLDALAYYLPSSDVFYGIDKFPPPAEYCSRHPHFSAGAVRDLDGVFDAGVCIEVIEHLTPRMLDDLLGQLAGKCTPQSCFIFNTGLSEYVRAENIGYLDPTGRGHIVSWTVKAVNVLARQHGFTAHPIHGKSWAFVLEQGSGPAGEDVRDRIWSALPENRKLLEDGKTGSLMYVLGIDTARAY